MARVARKLPSYSALHFVVAVGVAWAFTGDWRVALSIGLVEPVVQTLAYGVHEYLWLRLGSVSSQPSRPAAAAAAPL